jgi:hypothetical protein
MLNVREVICPWMFGKYRIKARAIVLYPFIIYRSDLDKRLFHRHEWVHVEQVRRLGWFRFYVSYLKEQYTVGYWDNKFEVEAREKAGI